MEKSKSTFIIIVILLILRIVLINGLRYYFSTLNYHIVVIYELIVYILIFTLIIINHSELPAYNIDKSSLILIILFSSLLRFEISNEKYWGYYSTIFWGISLGLLVILILKWPQLPSVKLKWILLSALLGFGIPLIYLLIQLINREQSVSLISIFINFVINTFFFMGHASIQEEILFRGFLWGYMQNKGISDKKTWLFTSFIFIVAHYYSLIYRNTTISGLIIFLIICLVYGWLVWCSRSVSPSMVSHSIFNSIIEVARNIKV